MTCEDYLSTIQMLLPREELLCQLAEECCELAQAALKLRRALDGRNPTPVDRAAAEAHLREEIADALVCLAALGPLWDGTPDADIQRAMERKAQRWAERLVEKEE